SSSAFDAYLAVDTVLSAAPVASKDNCATGGPDSCLRHLLLRRTGTYFVEATSSAAAQLGSFTLTVNRPRPPVAPEGLTQLRFDSVSVIGVAGAVAEGVVVLGAVGTDPDADSLQLEVEVRPVATAFNGLPTAVSANLASGRQGVVRVALGSDDAGYHWQARFVDQTGRRSAWTSFGGNAESSPDFVLAVPQAPADPANLAQLRDGGTVSIAVGGVSSSVTGLFTAVVADPDPADQLRLEVEVRPLGTTFAGTPTGSSTPTASGADAQASSTGLADNVSYHWQARTVDQTGRASAWVTFGGNAESEADFRVAVPPTQITFAVQPADGSAGADLSPAVRVSARDASGAVLASFTGDVTVALEANPGSAT